MISKEGCGGKISQEKYNPEINFIYFLSGWFDVQVQGPNKSYKHQGGSGGENSF